MDILEVNNLVKTFGGLTAVDELSFSLQENEIYGLIGPNGAGKTTVFNIITRFYEPDRGEVIYKTEDEAVNLLDLKAHQVIERGIARTFQNLELFDNLTVLENLLVGQHVNLGTGILQEILRLPGFFRKEDKAEKKALEMLDFFDLLSHRAKRAGSLPYGDQKLLELARILMSDPQIILLDEPAAGLNTSETGKLAERLRQIREEFSLTLFVVEHDMDLVMEICERICAINFGRAIEIGTPEEIQSSRSVQEAYLGKEEE